jgi:hypothetical protein
MGENAMIPRTMNPQTGAVVWHGSPHKFDKFDSSKIGTGEGAQAYGYGLYLAESPAVSKSYMQSNPLAMDIRAEAEKVGIKLSAGARGELSRQARANADPIDAAKKLQYANASTRDIPQDKLAEVVKRYQESLDGNLYKVDLPDEHIAKMLDWDKPVAQQPQAFAMSEALHKARAAKEAADSWKVVFDDRIGYAAQQEGAGLIPLGASTEAEAIAKLPAVIAKAGAKVDEGNWIAKHTGQQLINSMKEFYGPAKAAEILKQQGIPGIRYLDGSSRGAGTGTSNYVVFPGNEGLLQILERNGAPL